MNQTKTTTTNNQSGGSGQSQPLQQGRHMPESLEAEMSVLGSMLIDPECIGDVVAQIQDDSFYRIEHQAIFNALVHLYENNSAVDLVLLRNELERRGKLNDAGGVDYLVRVAEEVPSAASIEHYTEIVKNKAMLRQLIAATNEILAEAYDQQGDVSAKFDQAEQRIFAVTEKKITSAAVPIKHLIQEACENIENRSGGITGHSTGYFELDETLCGLHSGEMIIVAARPSMGKTSLALNIAEHIACDDNKAVVVFSLEMSKTQLVERLLCSRSHLDSQLVRNGNLNTDQFQLLTQTCGELYDKPLFIDDTPGITPLEMRAKCRRLKSQHDIQCIVVDYLQLMSMGGKVESRQQEVSTMSRYMKALAREIDVPVILLSQLNRAAESRDGHRPRMSDLRDSGSIEQDADVVMLLHREAYYHRGDPDYDHDSPEANVAEIIIAKQRNGPTGTIKLVFDGSITRFQNLSHVQDPF